MPDLDNSCLTATDRSKRLQVQLNLKACQRVRLSSARTFHLAKDYITSFKFQWR